GRQRTWLSTNPASCSYRLDHAHREWRWHDAAHPEAGLIEQRLVLLLGALASAGGEQHLDVEALADERLVAGWNDELDDQQPSALLHRAMTAREQRQRTLIVPVVQHVLEQVGVAARGYAREEVANDDLAAFAEPSRIDVSPGAFGSPWPLE